MPEPILPQSRPFRWFLLFCGSGAFGLGTAYSALFKGPQWVVYVGLLAFAANLWGVVASYREWKKGGYR